MFISFSTIKSYALEIALGKDIEKNFHNIGANNQFLTADTEETIWDATGLLIPLEEETQLFASSDNVNDIGISVMVSGVDGNFNRVNRLAILNGQNQVSLNAGLLICSSISVMAGNVQGNIYVATADTAPGGVPTALKVQCKALQGNNSGNTAIGVIPAGKTGFLRGIEYTTGKLNNIDIIINYKPFNGIWSKFPTIHLAESPAVIAKDTFIYFPEKSTILVNAVSKDNEAVLSMAMYFLEVTN